MFTWTIDVDDEFNEAQQKVSIVHKRLGPIVITYCSPVSGTSNGLYVINVRGTKLVFTFQSM